MVGEFAAVGDYVFDSSGKYVVDADGCPSFRSKPHRHQLAWPCNGSLVSKQSWMNLGTGWGSATVHIWYIGANADGSPKYLADEDVNLLADHRYGRQCPDGTMLISVLVKSTTTDNPVSWGLEVLAA